jgi:hypothetical protein
MTAITRVLLLVAAAVAIGLSVVPVAALTGSLLAERAVSAAMVKARATPPDFLTLAPASQPSELAVTIRDRSDEG